MQLIVPDFNPRVWSVRNRRSRSPAQYGSPPVPAHGREAVMSATTGLGVSVPANSRGWVRCRSMKEMNRLRSASPPATSPSRPRPSSTAARSSPGPRAAPGPASTATSGARGRRSTWRWTRLGNLLALHVTPADPARAGPGRMPLREVQEVTGDLPTGFLRSVTPATMRTDAASYGIHLVVVSLAEAKKGFVLLPRRWVVERSYG